MRRVYDLSMPIDPASGIHHPPTIQYIDHQHSTVHALFGVSPEEMPDGMGAAVEFVTARTHTGSHMDAPYHYYPTSGDHPARRIDQVPLEWCMGDGVLLDFHEKPAGYSISTEDLIEELRRIGHSLKPGDVVLIRTDTDRHFYDANYLKLSPGVSADATRWLIDQGIRLVGIDAWSWDVPLHLQGEEYRRTGNAGVMWAAHRVGKDTEYLQLEELGGLHLLPRPLGFTVYAFPIKIRDAGAGWVRAVAIFED